MTYGIPGLTTSSAGTRAVVGHGVHPQAARVLAELGGDGAGFAARQLNARLASDADVVITMTRAHRDVVLELAPRQLRKTFTLIEAARLVTECGAHTVAELAARRSFLDSDAGLDVPDPIGHGGDVYTAVAHQINTLLQPVLPLCQPD